MQSMYTARITGRQGMAASAEKLFEQPLMLERLARNNANAS